MSLQGSFEKQTGIGGFSAASRDGPAKPVEVAGPNRFHDGMVGFRVRNRCTYPMLETHGHAFDLFLLGLEPGTAHD